MSAKIVIIEDNNPDVVLLREALDQHGLTYDAMVIPDGEQAIEFVTSRSHDAQRPCLVVLDLNLPKRDGMEILRAIRGSASMSEVPVVILTTSDSPAERDLAVQAGANAFLQKPVDLDSFMALGGVLKGICEDAGAYRAP